MERIGIVFSNTDIVPHSQRQIIVTHLADGNIFATAGNENIGGPIRRQRAGTAVVRGAAAGRFADVVVVLVLVSVVIEMIYNFFRISLDSAIEGVALYEIPSPAADQGVQSASAV